MPSFGNHSKLQRRTASRKIAGGKPRKFSLGAVGALINHSAVSARAMQRGLVQLRETYNPGGRAPIHAIWLTGAALLWERAMGAKSRAWPAPTDRTVGHILMTQRYNHP